MRAVVQRVASARVRVDGETVGEIGRGLLIFLAVGREDGAEDVAWLAQRMGKIRVFEAEAGKMSQSLKDIGGDALVISQFTLFGSLQKGNRPSFNRAAPPQEARALYAGFVAALSGALEGKVATGRFGAHMVIDAQNDGPVTLIIDSQDREL
jgi:D-tyrosyl-tRNA(Tyr) deacylase